MRYKCNVSICLTTFVLHKENPQFKTSPPPPSDTTQSIPILSFICFNTTACGTINPPPSMFIAPSKFPIPTSIPHQLSFSCTTRKTAAPESPPAQNGLSPIGKMSSSFAGGEKLVGRVEFGAPFKNPSPRLIHIKTCTIHYSSSYSC